MFLASGGAPAFCDCAAAGESMTTRAAAIEPRHCAQSFMGNPLLLAVVSSGGLPARIARGDALGQEGGAAAMSIPPPQGDGAERSEAGGGMSYSRIGSAAR